jgi:hypothetical protein
MGELMDDSRVMRMKRESQEWAWRKNSKQRVFSVYYDLRRENMDDNPVFVLFLLLTLYSCRWVSTDPSQLLWYVA